MRWILAALLISMSVAHAQTTTPGASTPASPPAVSEPATPPAAAKSTTHRTRRTLQERFDDANTTHDGHLTLEQARAKMPSVARDFAAIDTDHKGYVTLDQIKAHTKAVRAEKRAAKKAAKEQH